MSKVCKGILSCAISTFLFSGCNLSPVTAGDELGPNSASRSHASENILPLSTPYCDSRLTNVVSATMDVYSIRGTRLDGSVAEYNFDPPAQTDLTNDKALEEILASLDSGSYSKVTLFSINQLSVKLSDGTFVNGIFEGQGNPFQLVLLAQNQPFPVGQNFSLLGCLPLRMIGDQYVILREQAQGINRMVILQ